MTPGNHDGYFMGNTSRAGDWWVNEWNGTAEKYERDGVSITAGNQAQKLRLGPKRPR